MFTKLEKPFSINWKNQMAGNSFQYFVKKASERIFCIFFYLLIFFDLLMSDRNFEQLL